MSLNYVNSDDIFRQINVNRLIYRTSTVSGDVYTRLIQQVLLDWLLGNRLTL